MTLEEIYEKNRASLAATAEHLPYLRSMAEGCDVIWEFGTKHGHSSSAFLMGLPPHGKLISVDLVITNRAKQLKKEAGNKWRLIQGSTLDRTILAVAPKPDLIFLDSLHTYEQLKEELWLWGNCSGKWLIFHDTITFATKGADGESGIYLPQPVDRAVFDPSSHGIRLAIDSFMVNNPIWRIHRHAPYGHGLLTLERT